MRDDYHYVVKVRQNGELILMDPALKQPIKEGELFDGKVVNWEYLMTRRYARENLKIYVFSVDMNRASSSYK